MPNTFDHSASLASAYRAYLIGADGRIERATPIDAGNDADAIEQVRRLIDGHTVELWDRTRMIVSFDPERQ